LDEACFILLQLKVEEDDQPDKFWTVYNTDPNAIESYIDGLQELSAVKERFDKAL
jgi:hypothetical protein